MESCENMRTELLIVQGTPFCNINCKYCYLDDRLNKRIMSLETVIKTITNLKDSNLLKEKISIAWHSGEPLVLPIDFYKSAYEEIKNILGDKILFQFSFQTNATLIDAKWCEFFKSYNISVGVSIDGPRFINDINRLSRSGKSTFENTLRGINLLKNHGIDFSAIAVVSRKSLSFAVDIYNFFADLGVTYLGLNIEELEGLNTSSSLGDSSTNLKKEFVTFYRSLYRNQLTSTKFLSIRELEKAKWKIVSDEKIVDNVLKPLKIITVDVEGNYTTFSPELLGNSHLGVDFTLGNVHKGLIRDCLDSIKYQKIMEDITRGIHNCEKSCAYFDLCGGGVPSNKFYENSRLDSTETLYCKYVVQSPIDMILEEAL